MNKYIITDEQLVSFSKYLFDEMKESREGKLKDDIWWKGYSTACERIDENFRAWREAEFRYNYMFNIKGGSIK